MDSLKLARKLKKLGVKEFKTSEFYVSFFGDVPKEDVALDGMQEQPLRTESDLPNYVKDIMGDEFSDGS